jgi:hypothetical protein
MSKGETRAIVSELVRAMPDFELDFDEYGVQSVSVVNMSGAVLVVEGMQFLQGQRRRIPDFFLQQRSWSSVLSRGIIRIDGR